ncbi:Transcriptional regulator, TetR family [Candidatus Rhodobacter oscarellae]|uniref:Transcriptional regulator, TetR family n=1 Tax=Candidatus Rhodobacter oscarellae TaxID=1675527 RepID=A0A0J9E4B1_9RHOB|nr:Transcriptional regulator, TetR family [Candidatus Rhodobacter lobularis]
MEKEETPQVRMSDIAKAAKVSRQAVYLHFENRADLLVATARHLDDVYKIGPTVEALHGLPALERLSGWVGIWGDYIPKVYGVGRALMAMMDGDAEARAAWDDRMSAVRRETGFAIDALAAEGLLCDHMTRDEARDFLWTLLSMRNWAQLRHEAGWSQDRYITHMQAVARRVLLKGAHAQA